MLWTTIEGNMGIICACLPLLRSVTIYLVPRFADRTSSTRGRRSRIAEEGASPTCGKGEEQHSEDVNGIPKDKDDPLAISYIEKGDSESVRSTEVVVGDKANFREP